MPQFAPSQLAALYQLFAKAGENSVPGSWLIDASVTLQKLAVAQLDARYATVAQGAHADAAYGGTAPVDSRYALAAAFSALAAVVAALPTNRLVTAHESFPGYAGGTTVTLAGTPYVGSEILVYWVGSLAPGLVTFLGSVVTFPSVPAGALDVVYLKEV